MGFVKFMAFVVASSISVSAWASMPAGTWKFERSVDYFGRTPVNKAPKFSTIVVRDNDVIFSDTCVVRASGEEYFFSDVFQPLTKQGVTDKQVDSFLMKHFNLSLSTTKIVHAIAATPKCKPPMLEIFFVKDKILVPEGVTFYLYSKAKPDTAVPESTRSASPMPAVAGYKATPLPMNYTRYETACFHKIRDGKGNPHTTDKCAPAFFPYVADPKSNDPIMKLVGNHDYSKGGEEEYADGFSPPFKRKVPATFLVFPPMKDINVVRVDDLQVVRNEERDVMSGVYLSIVGGKVVDQISGCDLGRDYVCTADGRNVAKLSDTGMFKSLISR